MKTFLMETVSRRRWPWMVAAVGGALLLGACGSDQSSLQDDDYGIVEPLEDTAPLGKADNAGVGALPTSVDDSDTQVWEVRNQWEDRNSAEAKKAGIGWPANSGLNWDEKYAKWIQSMEKIDSVGGYYTYDTFTLTTPWGKTLPAPKLECAELAMFLRVTFAAWYHLPFYLTSVDGHGTRVYFGHFGGRTRNGRYQDMPKYKLWYKDYSYMTAADIQRDGWPQDARLRQRGLYGGGDDMDFIFEGAKAGAYFDEIYLNKRVGHFVRLLLSYFGSVNLVSSRNTYNLKPEAIRAGDLLLERWQKIGIGHTLVVKQVTPLSEGRLEAQLVSGSMPRRQPKWEDGASSKSYFTTEEMGGEGTNYDGDAYVRLGGGLKRWRVAKKIGGKWTNTWMAGDEASWICDTDYERLKTRPTEFRTLLGEVSPEDLRASLLQRIEDARNHLREYPASCAARTRREKAFADLYDLDADKFGMSKAQTDRTYRILDDYVFAELQYETSKTCCWDSSTSAMYQVIMDYNRQQAEDQCVEATVFKAVGGGYDLFKQFAEQTGRGHLWKDWSEDEPCQARDVSDDSEVEHEWIPWCEASQGGGHGDTCTDDGYESNDNPNQATALSEGTYPDLQICKDNDDYYQVQLATGQSMTVTITFDHSVGDLDMALFRGGDQVDISQGTNDVETVHADEEGTYTLRIYGYSGATGTYSLAITID